MCSQGKKSLEMELTLILLITLIWLSVYKKNIFLILLFKIHEEKILKKIWINSMSKYSGTSI